MELKTVEDLKKLLNSGEKGVPIIIFGIEKQLLKDCIKLIYDTVKILPELNIITLEGDRINYDEVVNACESLPMISDRRVVHIKNPYFLRKSSSGDGEKGRKLEASSDPLLSYLQDYIKTVPSDSILFISCDDEIEGKNKLLQNIKTNGYSLEFKQLKGEELKNYVHNAFEKNGKKISSSDILYFITAASGPLEAMEKEIEKLCVYAMGEDTITKKHIDEVVHRAIENNIFKMVDNISIKNADIAISILNVLLFQKEDPLRILGMIIRQYRILYLIHLLQEQKKSLEEIKNNLRAKKINLMDFVLNNYVKQVKNYDGIGLRRALNLCSQADYDIKTSRFSSELVLETLIVQLCK